MSSALTNNVLQVSATMFCDGSLVVSNIGLDVLAAGDRFRLFVASAYPGSFTNVDLPPLSPGLSWRNDRTVGESITVVAASSPAFRAIRQAGTNLIRAGTNGSPNASVAVLAAANVALPLEQLGGEHCDQPVRPGRRLFVDQRHRPRKSARFFQLEVR